jgi:ADP-heptose:LPS heptosyltransferase
MRFSSMGDVAMTVPVIKQLLSAYPAVEIVFVSSASYASLFTNIERVHFIGADLKGRHAGIVGLWKLMQTCRRKTHLHAVADLHGVLRTWGLLFFFKLFGLPTASIRKGRFEKWRLTQRNNKIKKQLPSTFERYQGVFEKLGYLFEVKSGQLVKDALLQSQKIQIGVAPFAKHKGKMLPLETMKQTIMLLQQEFNCSIALFGAPGEEASILRGWANELPNVVCYAGVGDLQSELKTLSQLDLLISMDSANMHLASIGAVPVISIWGATHPYAGFLGWGQSTSNAVLLDLACQPCSVFGNKTCHRGDWACLQGIHPNQIVEKVRTYLCMA